MSERCVGNTGGVPRLGLRGLCTQDGPLGIRFSDYTSSFATGITAGASWSRRLWHDRGYKMGSEHRDKGVDILLGPALGPLGRNALGGRNWEGFTVDPYMLGKATANVVEGIQNAGVIACAKHYIVNEQGRCVLIACEIRIITGIRALPPRPRGCRLWIQHQRIHVLQRGRQDHARAIQLAVC